MLYTIFSKKDLLKQNKELLELHKRCIKDYLIQRDIRLSVRNKFFKLYDYYVNEENIREYFFRPVRIFVLALVLNKLNDIRDYFIEDNKPKKKKKKHATKKTI